jgi:hypothetical protein
VPNLKEARYHLMTGFLVYTREVYTICHLEPHIQGCKQTGAKYQYLGYPEFVSCLPQAEIMLILLIGQKT